MSKIYLVVLARKNIKSFIRFHIHANSRDEAESIAMKGMSGWYIRLSHTCVTPNKPFREYHGVKIWSTVKINPVTGESYNKYEVLYPGALATSVISDTISSFDSLKSFLGEQACMLL